MHPHHHDCRPHGLGKFERISLKIFHRAAGMGGRHRGGQGPHGHGGPGGGFGSGGRDDEMSRGRKFSSDDLQLIMLALLSDEARHGYDLIRIIATRSNGFYKPSPGVVYPALTYLEEIEYVHAEIEGARKRYALTDTGRRYLEDNRASADRLLERLDRFAQKMELIRRAFEQGPLDENGQPNALPEFLAARHALKAAIHARDNAAPEEQRRIAAILRRAVAEITEAKEQP